MGKQQSYSLFGPDNENEAQKKGIEFKDNSDEKQDKSHKPALHISGSEIPEAENKMKPDLLDFSYSRMDLYRTCPMRFKFRYVDKIKEKPKGFFFFGSAIHSALEFLYKGDSPVFPSIDEVCSAFMEFWLSKPFQLQGFRSAEESARKRDEGLAMLREYYRINEKEFKRAFLTERIFKFEIDGLLVTAISDRIDYLGNGKILITDYKTGKDIRRTPSQLYMYQKIAEANPELPELLAQKLGQKEEKLTISQMLYYHVPTNKKYFFERASDNEIKTFWDGALKTAEEMRAEKYDPTPSEHACRWCDYKQYCPIYGGDGTVHEYEKENANADHGAKNSNSSSPESGKQEIMPENNPEASLLQLLNRYGDLEERKAVIEKEQEILKQRIGSLRLTSGDYNTGRYTAAISRKTAWKAESRKDVITLLNDYGLYERACTLTMSGIISLLNNMDTPAIFREKLRAMLKKEEHNIIETKKNSI